MDLDILSRIGEVIITAIIAQDTTEYLERMNANCVLTEDFTVEGADQLQQPSTPRTTVQSPRKPPPTGGGGGATTPRKQGGGGGGGNVTPRGGPGGASVMSAKIEAGPTVTTGPIACGLRTRRLFKWLQAGQLSQPSFSAEVVRVARKAYGARYDPKDDKRDVRSLSSVSVTWGRTQFLFEDKCYVYEDGSIAAIDRRVIPPADPAHPSYILERNSFLLEGKAKLNPTASKPPVLDFSFCDLSEAVDLLRIAPRAGKQAKRAKIYVPKQEKEQQSSTYNPMSQAEKQKSIMIRAKNRAGEEEAYEFQDAPAGETVVKGAEGKPTDAVGDLINSLSKDLPGKYNTEAVRLANNNLAELDRIVPVLRSLVVDSVLTVTWLDLSCNQLTSVPTSLDTLTQLSVLYLHSNNIESWDHVKTLRNTLTSIHTLTLYGNPIATKNRDYKQIALSILLDAPEGAVPLKSLDFVVVSLQDRHVTQMYEQFHPTQSKKLESQRAIRERTSKLQATFGY